MSDYIELAELVALRVFAALAGVALWCLGYLAGRTLERGDRDRQARHVRPSHRYGHKASSCVDSGPGEARESEAVRVVRAEGASRASEASESAREASPGG